MTLDPTSTAIVSGALAGLAVRFWRYKPRGKVAVKNVAIGAISTATLWHLLPDEIDALWAFISAYFVSQGSGYVEPLKAVKKIKDIKLPKLPKL